MTSSTVVEGVCSEVFDKLGLSGDLIGGYTELFYDDAFYLFFDSVVGHGKFECAG